MNQLGLPNKNSGKGGKFSPMEKYCWRCGSKLHLAKDCPLPFQKVLAFGPNSSASVAGKGEGEGKLCIFPLEKYQASMKY